ncbi:MAG TPA: TolC family protein [Polyangiaceae bacterium]|nr:TolC family protein [Polyangiaceae bacterium]
MLGALGIVLHLLAQAGPPPGTTLTLAAAERQALAHQAQIAQAVAQTDAAYARADEQESQLLPQVNANGAYTRKTANFVPQATTLPTSVSQHTAAPSFDTIGSWNFGINANQLVYDFGQTIQQYKSARASAESQKLSEETVRQGVLYGVRSAFVLAWANRALVDVAKDALDNQDKHLAQVQGQVTVGTRPEIDLAQVRADRANAKLTLINAQNSYETAKAQLNQAMGVEGTTAYDVAIDRIPELPEEQLEDERVAAMGLSARPELKSLAKQEEANERQLSSVRGTYGPSLGVSTGFTEGGPDLTNMVWNWNAQAQLSWQIFQGGLTKARVREAIANQAVTHSQTVLERQQVRLDVIQARLAVRAGKAGLDTAKEVEVNAKEQLRLAEARYQAGAGSIIELQDAQVAATTASGQVVQADYNLSLARAQLLKAIGRR